MGLGVRGEEAANFLAVRINPNRFHTWPAKCTQAGRHTPDLHKLDVVGPQTRNTSLAGWVLCCLLGMDMSNNIFEIVTHFQIELFVCHSL